MVFDGLPSKTYGIVRVARYVAFYSRRLLCTTYVYEQGKPSRPKDTDHDYHLNWVLMKWNLFSMPYSTNADV